MTLPSAKALAAAVGKVAPAKPLAEVAPTLKLLRLSPSLLRSTM